MRLLSPIESAAFFVCLAASTALAAPVELSRFELTLPPDASLPRFIDIDGDGLADVLVLDQARKQILNYHQRPDGFRNSPDQSIPLPPETSWVTACDVDAHPGLELLFSTGSGLVYSVQNGGLFEPELRTLIATNQGLRDFDHPIFGGFGTNMSGTNLGLPVILPGQVVIYRRDKDYHWASSPAHSLDAVRSSWNVASGPFLEGDSWSLGSAPAHILRAREYFRPNAPVLEDNEPENEGIKNILHEMPLATTGNGPHIEKVDINGDGREDLVLWQSDFSMHFKTDLYVFLRGADGKLPQQPSQVLHSRGYPIPLRSTWNVTPVKDINGDGICEFVLLDLKTHLTSAGDLVSTALSRGLEFTLDIRSFRNGQFSHNPDASVAVTQILQTDLDRAWPIFVEGDFNGDGRPDLLVQRSDTRWNIFYSTADGQGFEQQPSATFEVSGRGEIQVQNKVNHELSAVVWHESDKDRLSIFMSPSRAVTGKQP